MFSKLFFAALLGVLLVSGFATNEVQAQDTKIMVLKRFDSTSSIQTTYQQLSLRKNIVDSTVITKFRLLPIDTLFAIRITTLADSVNYSLAVQFLSNGIVDTSLTVTHNAMGSTYKNFHQAFWYQRPPGSDACRVILTSDNADSPTDPRSYLGSTTYYYQVELIFKQ